MSGNRIVGVKTRKQILAFITEYMEEHGYAPSYVEIGEGVGLSSKATVKHHLEYMFQIRMLETDHPGCPRAIRVPGFKFVKE